MNLRPLNDELMFHCAETDYCTKCKFRAGCPIRYSFYARSFENDIDFEIFLQSLEIKASKVFGKERAFDGAAHIRNKYNLEKRNNPYFSYT